MSRLQMIDKIGAAIAVPVVMVGCGLLMATPAHPAACGERAKVVETLQEKYGETRRGIGVAAGNRVLEVYASAKTGSWTAIISTMDGRACIVGSGDRWQQWPAEPDEVAS